MLHIHYDRVALDEIRKKMKPDLESIRARQCVLLSTAAYRAFYKREGIFFHSMSLSINLTYF